MEISEIIGQKNKSVITNKLRTAKMALRVVKAKARLNQARHPPALGTGRILMDETTPAFGLRMAGSVRLMGQLDEYFFQIIRVVQAFEFLYGG